MGTSSKTSPSPIKKFTKGRKNQWPKFLGARYKAEAKSGKSQSEIMTAASTDWNALDKGAVIEVNTGE